MKTIEIMNLILKKANELNLNINTDISVLNNEIDPVQPMIEIDIETKQHKYFAFYFAMYEANINYSSGFLVNDMNDLTAKNLFDSNSGIFTEYNLIDQFNMIELTGSVKCCDVTEEFIDDILDYITKDSELSNHLNSIVSGAEFDKEYDHTNLLLKKLYQTKLDVTVELNAYEEDSETFTIQINVKPKYFDDFAIFYNIFDEKINYSSIFLCHDKLQHTKEIFEKDKGIFQECIDEMEEKEVHLFGSVLVEQVNEEFVDKIAEYLLLDHELTKYLSNK